MWSTPAALKLLATNMPVVVALAGVIGMFLALVGGMEVYKYVKYKKWETFGNRLKEAYTAKFGYPNPAFEKEVDQHVLAMRALGKGDTKAVNEDWLRRMAKFVEVPWAVPEEEHLTEVEKTNEFDTGHTNVED